MIAVCGGRKRRALRHRMTYFSSFTGIMELKKIVFGLLVVFFLLWSHSVGWAKSRIEWRFSVWVQTTCRGSERLEWFSIFICFIPYPLFTLLQTSCSRSDWLFFWFAHVDHNNPFSCLIFFLFLYFVVIRAFSSNSFALYGSSGFLCFPEYICFFLFFLLCLLNVIISVPSLRKILIVSGTMTIKDVILKLSEYVQPSRIISVRDSDGYQIPDDVSIAHLRAATQRVVLFPILDNEIDT